MKSTEVYSKLHDSNESILADAIRRSEGSKDISIVHSCLSNGSIGSSFVKGSGKNSLFCTLPMAMKPPSSVVEHSPPLQLTHLPLLNELDAELCKHLSKMSSKPREGSLAADVSSASISNTVAKNVWRGIKVGDLVALSRMSTIPTSLSTGQVDVAAADKCLGDREWGRIGVVLHSRKSGATVKEIISGFIADYKFKDLVFADGSHLKFKDSVSLASTAATAVLPANPAAVNPPCASCGANTFSISGVGLQAANCDSCGRSGIHTYCSTAYECFTCGSVVCQSCVSNAVTAGGAAKPMGLPLTPSLFEVSSYSSSYPKNKLADEDITTFWQSNSSPPHWIELTFPSNCIYPEVQLYTKDHGSFSPKDISIYLHDGTSFSKVKDMTLPNTSSWVTLLSSAEILQASPTKMPTKIKIQLNNNHSGGCDTKVTSVRLMGKPKAMHVPLVLGERVKLASSFSENEGNGWCLGTHADNREGVVVAVTPTAKNSEQRNILVYCEQSESKLALFKGCWLERAAFSTRHCVGDIVRLNAGTCNDNTAELIVGKCLGSPADAKFGIVTAIGPVVENIQRNVQVALMEPVDDPMKLARVSLYCASKLSKVDAFSVNHPRVLDEMISAVKRAVIKPDGTSRLNAEVLVNRFGIAAWGNLMALLGPSAVLEHVYSWIQSCKRVNLKIKVSKSIADYYAGVIIVPGLDADKESTIGTSTGAGTPSPGINMPSNWVCKVCSWENPLDVGSCNACATVVEKWTCLACKVGNVADLTSCYRCAVPQGQTSASPAVAAAEVIELDALKKPADFKGFKGYKGPKVLSKGHVAVAGAAITMGDAPKQTPFLIKPCAEDIAVSSNMENRERIFNGDLSSHWESNGSTSGGHWLEFKIPDDKILQDLSIFLKSFSTFSPKDVRIFIVPQYVVTTPQYHLAQSTTGCDTSCSRSHSPSDLCLKCGKTYSAHSSHTCQNGSRSSFVPASQGLLKLSSKYPPDCLIRIKQVSLQQTDAWYELISPEECAKYQPGIVRIEVLSHHGSASDCRIVELRANAVNKQKCRWSCRLCHEINSELKSTDTCLNCHTRKPVYSFGRLPQPTVSTRGSTKPTLIRVGALKHMPEDVKQIAWNCSQDALGRCLYQNAKAEALASAQSSAATATAAATVDDADDAVHPAIHDNAEISFNSTIVNVSSFMTTSDQLLGPALDDEEFLEFANLQREESMEFWSSDKFEPITEFEDLTEFRDKLGNTAAHHLAYMKFKRSYQVILDNGGDKQRYKMNLHGQTPAGLLDGVVGKTREFLIHKYCSQRMLTSSVSLMPLHYTETYVPDGELAAVLQDIKAGDYEMAIERAGAAGADETSNCGPHYRVYLALASLYDGFGTKAAEIELEEYVEVVTDMNISLDPMYFFVLYLLFKIEKPSSKAARNRAADALAVFKLFPVLKQDWVQEEDNLDEIVHREDQANEDGIDDDDDNDELEEELDPDSPEVMWRVAKAKRGVKSPAMDKLMSLVGLKKVKERALAVYQRTLVDPFRPKDVDATTAMNFLFIGNPGCGKTTVAELLAAALVELKFRKNPNPCITSASKILKSQNPVAEFEDMVKKAAGGTVFIDECYLFKPSPPGQQANHSNGVLDYLLEVAETMRSTTTFILAGYKEDVQRLLTYNEGFPSRFPKVFTFPFDDYTEPQLRSILLSMVKQRGFRFDSKRNCGVSIAKVLSMRIARGRGVKGFGNAREVRNQLDACIQRQEARFGAIILKSNDPDFSITPKEMVTLTKADTIGDRPNLEASPALKELDAMVGLESVKRAVRGLMQLQLQNYDREMRGEDIERISLHRVFLGNPGTGKTTVAKLYGRVLKEFGLLTDGDYIATTASSLMGEHVGAGATQTAQMLEKAKGKVLFIDEAYVLDPKRRGGNDFGGSVLDTLVEKIEGAAGMDMAVILAGYENDMLALFRNCGNPGLARRFQLSESLRFDDFADKDLKIVMKRMVAKDRLVISPSTVEEAIKIVSRRRRLPGFGNAGEVENFLGRAKANKALRLAAAAAELDHARRMGQFPLPAIPRPDVLLLCDFISEETSADKAKEGFATMQNMEHIYSYINRLEATILEKKREGKSPAEIVADTHMIFTGPPGTGKTTAARKFGQLLFNLELLPTDHVVETTAKTMLGQYVGQTAQLVTAKMEEARGGVLFIDEAYSLIPSAGSYASDAVQTLLDNITKTEFKGNLVIILAGYEKDLNMLFTVNAGLSSRFDKHRIAFPSWTASQARDATVAAVHRDNKTLTKEAEDLLYQYFITLESLPSWASARDVYETILPSMYSHRAERLAQEAKAATSLSSTTAAGASTSAASKFPSTNSAAVVLPPYTGADVRLACTPLLKSRQTIATNLGHRSLEASGLIGRNNRNWHDRNSQAGFGGNADIESSDEDVDSFFPPLPPSSRDVLPSPADSHTDHTANLDNIRKQQNSAPSTLSPVKKAADHSAEEEEALQSAAQESASAAADPVATTSNTGDANKNGDGNRTQAKEKTQYKYKKLDPDDKPTLPTDPNGTNVGNLVALLEEACAELGYSIQQMEKFLLSGVLPEELVTLVWEKNGGSESNISTTMVASALRKQAPGLLMKVRTIIRQMEQEKAAEEAKRQEKLRVMGKCCMGFEWLKMEGGYRCAGGSHYCSDAELDQYNM